jgi:hypothetical protein
MRIKPILRKDPVMKRVLLISFLLVLALVGWSTVCADDGFYVISGVRRNYAPVPQTGQTGDIWGPGCDGALKKGVAWPTPRFTDNNNGTVTDRLTGLIWMRNVNVPTPLPAMKNWQAALDAASALRSGSEWGYGLTDGSMPKDWRLPNVRELQSLLDYGRSPALPLGHPFTANGASLFGPFWSSTSRDGDGNAAWMVQFGGLAGNGSVWASSKTSVTYVWCVRDGR